MHVFTILNYASCKSQTYRQIYIDCYSYRQIDGSQTNATPQVTKVAHINTMATDYYLCATVTNYEFRRQINYKLIIQKSTDTLPARTKLFQAGRQTDVTQRTVGSSNFANALETS